MPTEEEINNILSGVLSDNIELSFKAAATFDDLEESDAIMQYALNLLSQKPHPILLAVQAAAMTIRWHRTRKLEAAVNSPGPGQSPE